MHAIAKGTGSEKIITTGSGIHAFGPGDPVHRGKNLPAVATGDELTAAIMDGAQVRSGRYRVSLPVHAVVRTAHSLAYHDKPALAVSDGG